MPTILGLKEPEIERVARLKSRRVWVASRSMQHKLELYGLCPKEQGVVGGSCPGEDLRQGGIGSSMTRWGSRYPCVDRCAVGHRDGRRDAASLMTVRRWRLAGLPFPTVMAHRGASFLAPGRAVIDWPSGRGLWKRTFQRKTVC